MKILLSPAKLMKIQDDHGLKPTRPAFLEKSAVLEKDLEQMSQAQLQECFKISAKTAQPVYTQYQNLKKGLQPPLCPAIAAYQGIAYQYMAPHVLTDDQLAYLQDHLRIISGLYGLLRPLDEIMFYRLEMGRKIPYSLYDFWSETLTSSLDREDWILNLASREYSRTIQRDMVTVRFFDQTANGLKEKGVHAKMARGAMVRFCAENLVETPRQLESFHEFGFAFDPALSSPQEMVFVRDGWIPIKESRS